MTDTKESILSEIDAERTRQESIEGWTFEHDDKHDFGELAKAAACYAMPQSVRNITVDPYSMDNILQRIWPFSKDWWKPTNRRRDLIKAAALIVAEIERLDRAKVK